MQSVNACREYADGLLADSLNRVHHLLFISSIQGGSNNVNIPSMQ